MTRYRIATDKDYWEWLEKGRRNGWHAQRPKAAPWKRWPVIRHARSIILAAGMARWYTHGPGQFGIPTGYDEWALYGIWKGWEIDE